MAARKTADTVRLVSPSGPIVVVTAEKAERLLKSGFTKVRATSKTTAAGTKTEAAE